MSSVTMTIRLDSELKDKLEQLADAMARKKSFLAVQAIAEYVKTQQWQIADIKAGIAEADAGHLVDHEEVEKRWEQKRENSLGKNSH